jgi:hypothetical protein
MTIENNVGFELDFLHSTPTTSISTGQRWYTGVKDGEPTLVYHTEGTPSNQSTTSVFSPSEAKSLFSWDWDHNPEFVPVRRWIEAIMNKLEI